MKTQKRATEYVQSWRNRGYPDGVPDEVPHVLRKLGLAPSYQALALAILSNDMDLISLGFPVKYTPWYSAFKRVEIEGRNK